MIVDNKLKVKLCFGKMDNFQRFTLVGINMKFNLFVSIIYHIIVLSFLQMKRDNDTNSNPESEVFKSETTPVLQVSIDFC